MKKVKFLFIYATFSVIYRVIIKMSDYESDDEFGVFDQETSDEEIEFSDADSE